MLKQAVLSEQYYSPDGELFSFLGPPAKSMKEFFLRQVIFQSMLKQAVLSEFKKTHNSYATLLTWSPKKDLEGSKGCDVIFDAALFQCF